MCFTAALMSRPARSKKMDDRLKIILQMVIC